MGRVKLPSGEIRPFARNVWRPSSASGIDGGTGALGREKSFVYSRSRIVYGGESNAFVAG